MGSNHSQGEFFQPYILYLIIIIMILRVYAVIVVGIYLFVMWQLASNDIYYSLTSEI